MKRLSVALLFIPLFIFASRSFVPATVDAAVPTVDLTTFNITSPMRLSPFGQFGPGSFGDGNPGAYIEASCVPMKVELTNPGTTTADFAVTLGYDHADDVTGIVGLESIVPNSGNMASLNNLDDFTFTRNDFSGATHVSTGFSNAASLSVTGPTTGVGEASYDVTVHNLRAHDTARFLFCARLGVDAFETVDPSINLNVSSLDEATIAASGLKLLPSLTMTTNVTNGSSEASAFSYAITNAMSGNSVVNAAEGENSYVIENVIPGSFITATPSTAPDYYAVEGADSATCTFDDADVGTPTFDVDHSGDMNDAECVFNATYTAPTLKVHIAKYLDGELATTESANGYAFPMTATWDSANIGAGTGTYVLGNGHGGAPSLYQADTALMEGPADYVTSEITTATDSSSRVLPAGAECAEGRYRLIGYSIGDTLESAVSGQIGAEPFEFDGIIMDKYVIVWNETCPDEPDEIVCSEDPILLNGSFESPEITDGDRWDIIPNGTEGLGWTSAWVENNFSSTGVEIQELYSDWAAADGDQYTELDADGPTVISQDLTTIPGATYTVSFAFSPRPGTDAADNAVNVYANGVLIGSVAVTESVSNTSWTTHSFTFEAEFDMTTIGFADAGTPSNSLGSFIDDVHVSCGIVDDPEDPEPEMVKVHIYKYLDGELANTESANGYEFPMTSTWSAENIGAGSGSYLLGNFEGSAALEYQADTSAMQAPAEYATEEVTGGESLVLPLDASCEPGKYRLTGYSFGATREQAEVANVSRHGIDLANITSDVSVIVWNETCPSTPAPTEQIMPIAQCVIPDGELGFTAYFGYDSSNDVETMVARGPFNSLIGTDTLPPETFDAGDEFSVYPNYAFSAYSAAAPIEWTLNYDGAHPLMASTMGVPECPTVTDTIVRVTVEVENTLGDLAPEDVQFGVSIDDGEPEMFYGDDEPIDVPVSAGHYKVKVNGPIDGYSVDLDETCTGDVSTGDTALCTIHVVQDSDAEEMGSLMVKKLIADREGAIHAEVSDFSFFASPLNSDFAQVGQTFEVDVAISTILPSGFYRIEEEANEESGLSTHDYMPDFSDCVYEDEGGTHGGDTYGIVYVPADGQVTCEIVNNMRVIDDGGDGGDDGDDEDPATGTLTVITHVINDNAGIRLAGEFQMSVSGAGASPSAFSGSEEGVVVALDDGAVFSVGQANSAGYTVTMSGDCSGTIDAESDEDLVCIVTSDDEIPAGSGGTSPDNGGSGGTGGNGGSPSGEVLGDTDENTDDNGGADDNDDAPDGIVLGDTTSDTSGSSSNGIGGVVEEGGLGIGGEVLGATDELPRTGFPLAPFALVASAALYATSRRSRK